MSQLQSELGDAVEEVELLMKQGQKAKIVSKRMQAELTMTGARLEEERRRRLGEMQERRLQETRSEREKEEMRMDFLAGLKRIREEEEEARRALDAAEDEVRRVRTGLDRRTESLVARCEETERLHSLRNHFNMFKTNRLLLSTLVCSVSRQLRNAGRCLLRRCYDALCSLLDACGERGRRRLLSSLLISARRLLLSGCFNHWTRFQCVVQSQELQARVSSCQRSQLHLWLKRRQVRQDSKFVSVEVVCPDNDG
ncbi:hypothetical protein GUITHDRAFT_121730 [Guillardia theta CCMP2712]|uniref:Uncharacterized protein n=1 Tax=Guillardia theta (strain CCMP2712) TaxID=905079 RepID=L1I871_GUITC|nr:hypothetical protein GUITHDRAFT_121730 [Guillardia theta CCMP2712]EKX32104.1 hypothetical protein GUITHDRAFT_121730 [Guillardia theta CCMP2712]|eukprot:XP_005819084.1 hypothetical protein GUITHDRAFT_121730 [Guillardia theta CCMP2712]